MNESRGVEFHDLKEQAEESMRMLFGYQEPIEFGARSCEEIAESLAGALREHGVAVLEVTVSEDGENGATVRAGS